MDRSGEARALLDTWAPTAAVDHHCHPLWRWPLPAPLDPMGLRTAFTEAHDPRVPAGHTPDTVAYRTVLRRLGAELGCAPTEQAILEVRAGEDPAAYATRLLDRSGTGMMLVDHGFATAATFTVAEHVRQVAVPQREIVRLESLAENRLEGCSEPGEWFESVRAGLREAVAAGAAGVKTIAAYRAGLRLGRPDPEEVAGAFGHLRRSEPGPGPAAREAGRGVRLTGEALCHALVFEGAAECASLGVPLQVHCGFGDPDLDLALCSPLGLRPLLADPRYGGLQLVLLHCYPYHREAAWLCSVYPDVHMDLSLAIPLAALDGARAVAETLGLCPWSKLLYATDASRLPEVYFVAAALHREALADAFGACVRAGILDAAEAAEAGRRVLTGNAARLYRIDAPE
ncbi:MAG TPA: amidohydrolase family protein [Actinomycetota bacterium]|jgi:hypothetical protein